MHAPNASRRDHDLGNLLARRLGWEEMLLPDSHQW
jgi:hypothetical protein